MILETRRSQNFELLSGIATQRPHYTANGSELFSPVPLSNSNILAPPGRHAATEAHRDVLALNGPTSTPN